MNKRWTVYCHTHAESGRRYIGLTKKTMLFRWNQHVQNAKTKRGKGCHHFWNAIRKYGKEAFSHEVLAMGWDLDGANAIEQWLIEFYDTRDPEKGFNLAKGGAHTPHPQRNPWDDPNYRTKKVQNGKSQWNDPEIRRKNTSGIRDAILRPEVQQNRSHASKLVNSRSDVRARIGFANSSREVSRETRFKLRASRLGKSLNPATKEKLREAGLSRDPAINARIGATSRARAKVLHDLRPPVTERICKRHGLQSISAYYTVREPRNLSGFTYHCKMCRKEKNACRSNRS